MLKPTCFDCGVSAPLLDVDVPWRQVFSSSSPQQFDVRCVHAGVVVDVDGVASCVLLEAVVGVVDDSSSVLMQEVQDCRYRSLLRNHRN